MPPKRSRYNESRYSIEARDRELFADKRTRALFETGKSRRWKSVARVATRKLVQIDSVIALDELNVLPGNRLEALKRERKGLHSIRINDQWRICFRWLMASMMWRSSITTNEEQNMSIARPEKGWNITRSPVHPGEMLREEFMKPLGISINGLALELHVPVTHQRNRE